jgi:hypothetical protein
MWRPAAKIDPVSPMASNSAALRGPIAIDDPSKYGARFQPIVHVLVLFVSLSSSGRSSLLDV